MGIIECQNLKVQLSTWEGSFSCAFQEGAWHVICGGSGSGKSTLMRTMLGLTTPISGDLLIDGKSIVMEPPHKRQMSFMAQYNLLVPHMTVKDNLSLVLHDTKLTPREKSEKIDEILVLLKLDTAHLDRLPKNLSGGQLSRCNLARAILRPARWLLLDEPFAAVDRPTRLLILDWLRGWQDHNGTGILLVSHDLDDIFNVASHVTVVSHGQVIESNTLPDAISSPQNLSTASLLRTGAIIRDGARITFVNSENLYTSPQVPDCAAHDLTEIKIPRARVVAIGKSMRVIDLSTGLDVTITSTNGFAGSLWFDKRNARTLSDR